MKRVQLRSCFAWTAWVALLLFVLLRCRLSLHWSSASDSYGPAFYFEFSAVSCSIVRVGVPASPV